MLGQLGQRPIALDGSRRLTFQLHPHNHSFAKLCVPREAVGFCCRIRRDFEQNCHSRFREAVSYVSRDETNMVSGEAIFLHPRKCPETADSYNTRMIQQWSSIMWALISILYRSYCLARLVEMRRFELGH
jgi:hypothetical protein